MADNFGVLALQTIVHYCDSRQDVVDKHINRHLELLYSLVPFYGGLVGAPIRVVVFPEFATCGFPQNPDGTWNGVGISIPGPETELLSQAARDLNIYICSHAWEEYPDLPGRPLSVGFIIDPQGEIILKHHKTVTTKLLESGSASPLDVYDWFAGRFGDGLEAFYPVARTELGNLGIMICGEGTYGETARGLVMNGAEIILRPNAWLDPLMVEPNDMQTTLTKFAAFTNMAYVIEANWAGAPDDRVPSNGGFGASHVVDYYGRLLARSSGPGEMGIGTAINIESLRQYRENMQFGARMVFQPNEIFRKVYETGMWPKNSLMSEARSKNMFEWEMVRQQVLARRADIFTPSREGGR